MPKTPCDRQGGQRLEAGPPLIEKLPSHGEFFCLEAGDALLSGDGFRVDA
jgi:hypothetical protein